MFEFVPAKSISCVCLLIFSLCSHSALSAELTAKSFIHKGLNLESELTAIYLGDFEHAKLEPGGAAFNTLFGNYLYAFGRQCAAHLPANKVEMTESKCVREQYEVNGYGMRTGSSQCIEYRDFGTGVYADPALYATSKKIASKLGNKMLGQIFTNRDPFATRRILDEAVSAAGDMSRLVTQNACNSAALKRFEMNMHLFAKGEPGLRLDSGERLSDVIASKASNLKAKDINLTKLIDDLIVENSKGWMMNRYSPGNVYAVKVVSKDNAGRPRRVDANYNFLSFGKTARGAVKLIFQDHVPKCLYFADAPQTCRVPSRGIVNAFDQGKY
ncbi:hypothetical protein [Neptunicella marina]|uniref:Uncharacterized protein n=1 Tax=Neptunicella marina TaxID=2125989 RepID=A0A8J6M1J5_9ALTE|nr:hypothetical protein [Neptunicella marina]MBC3765502.1 hypothetical protein [Neptunicella marina]